MSLRRRVNALGGGRGRVPGQDEWIHILAAESDAEKDAVVERLRSRFPQWVDEWFAMRARQAAARVATEREAKAAGSPLI